MRTSSKSGLSAYSWRGLLTWSLVAFFACAGLLNVFATVPLLAEYRRWGYPGWMHKLTGLLELASAVMQARRATSKFGVGLGALVMLAAVLTLALHREWLHAFIPVLVLLALITSRITHQS